MVDDPPRLWSATASMSDDVMKASESRTLTQIRCPETHGPYDHLSDVVFVRLVHLIAAMNGTYGMYDTLHLEHTSSLVWTIAALQNEIR